MVAQIQTLLSDKENEELQGLQKQIVIMDRLFAGLENGKIMVQNQPQDPFLLTYQYFSCLKNELNVTKDKEERISELLSDSHLVVFCRNCLLICANKTENYAEMLKDIIVELLVQLTAHENICVPNQLCKEENAILPILGQYLNMDEKKLAIKTRLGVLYLLANICLEENHYFKNCVIQRAHLISFLDDIINRDIEEMFVKNLPWVVKSLVITGWNHVLDQPDVYQSLVKIMA